MTVNYRSLYEHLSYEETQKELMDHYKWLTTYKGNSPGKITGYTPPDGYQEYHVVDVLGNEFIWMNETFTKDKFTWYVWYESVFLVPDEMLTFLALRWS